MLYSEVLLDTMGCSVYYLAINREMPALAKAGIFAFRKCNNSVRFFTPNFMILSPFVYYD
jgi:hypothetical protein